MTLLTKDNLVSFMDYYHSLHDSYVTDVKYDYKNVKIEIFIDVFWSGEPIIKEDNTYETNKTKLKMVCSNVYQFNFKETYIDDIDEAYLKYIIIDNKEYICFATDKEEPLISVVCERIEYEELNN